MDDELVATGRYARIRTFGRRSGEAREVTVGYVETTDGDVLVAARQGAAWAENLLDDPRCRVTIGARTWDALAEPLGGADFAQVVRESILRYGTPAETLGSGPAFRLRAVTGGAP
jgi:deazaflavin-dependent oxidoreductase (nitroreductase family)